ncbi:mcm2 3 5 family protein [Stylonychia lemnae]|uniref:DNA replication licensing factor MCM2 n=1 Tax=Stylonychia lemnae TaxID=5949 RepID=A0A078AXW8_STYLE|nr:mcm2 3 5 family protein [Stylonychia lemnae]|eukprot:CDW86911.1 mcm2 3 5 family protein [Stylonychia lemnae]
MRIYCLGNTLSLINIISADNEEDSQSEGEIRTQRVQEEQECFEDEFERDEDQVDNEEEDGEDILENMENDYNANPELDRYEEEGIDDEQQEELDQFQRRQIEKELLQQERLMQIDQQNLKKRVPAAFMDTDMNEDMANEEDEESQQVKRKQNMQRLKQLDILDFEDVRGKISTWIQRPEVVLWIRKNFSHFLRTYKDENQVNVYEQRINEMCSQNKQSLEVNFSHLSRQNPTLAIWLAEEPLRILPILNTVAYEITLELYSEYFNIHNELYVRIIELPVEDKIRDLRRLHINQLIKVKGVVTKRSSIFPELNMIYFRCQCGDLKGPIYHSNSKEPRQYLGQCVMCQSNGPYTIDESKTLYRNYQKMTIQETPGSVPPGRVPRQKDIYLINDQVDSARPGDEVEITGIFINIFDYISNIKHGFPVFNTIIEANYVKRHGDEDMIILTDEDKEEITKLAKQPLIGQKIINSIAPSIYGHKFVKKALALAMFGGESKDISGKHRIRGDINVLMLGDPGTAKSQFLKYVEQVYHRVVYTTGKGASAVGLTAGVHRDPSTGDWVLEGGALVLADKGICLIDEFDKMNDQDRTSIHEAMEQQSISISKAGIVTTLSARCSIIAAANPVKGVYNTALNFIDNVDLTDPILSRFDILSVIKDEVNEEHDDALSTFVINSHIKSHPEVQKDLKFLKKDEECKTEEDFKNYQLTMEYLSSTLLDNSKLQTDQSETIDQQMLRKYIIYAKKYVHPKLNEIDKDKITQFYADIRRESSLVQGIPIAVRHIESVLRMAEAHAKLHLRDYVRIDDIDLAIEMLLESFLQSQKLSVARHLAKRFEQYKTKKSDPNQILIHLLKKMVSDRALYDKYIKGLDDNERIKVMIPLDQLRNEAKDLAHHHVDDFLYSDVFKKEYLLDGRNIVTLKEV